MNLYYKTELYHYGVKGMKWGVRKAKISAARTARKKKYDNIISKNKNDDGSDLRFIKEANKNMGSRIAKTAVSRMTGQLLFDVFTGEIGRYSKMNKRQLATELTKKAASIASSTAVDIAVKNAQARSAAKKFGDDGKRVKGKKDRMFTKEHMIERSVNLAISAAPLINGVMKMKMMEANMKRQANEARFKRWGANILPEKTKTVGNTIWVSDDGKTSIIDPR